MSLYELRYDVESCCICLDVKSKSPAGHDNRLMFTIMDKKTKKETNVNVYICDVCVIKYDTRNMNESEIICKLLNLIHPIVKKNIMNN
jgi:hypothetical protein